MQTIGDFSNNLDDSSVVTVTSLSDYRNGILNHTIWRNRVDPHEYAYIHNPKDICVAVSDLEKIILLIIVTSHPRNNIQRNFIRTTWAKQSPYYTDSTQTITIFLLGKETSTIETSQQLVDEEAQLTNDILQESFSDEYLNLTIKTMMGLKWASKFCPRANFVFKTDDDMLINADKLLSYIKRAPSQNFFGGKVADTTVLRDYGNKFFTPRSVYAYDNYPPYCEGLGYLMSMDIVHKLYFRSMVTPLFPWEDVFVGILLKQLSIKLTNIPNFCSVGWYFDENDTMHDTSYAIGKLRTYFSFHGLNMHEMAQIWQLWRRPPDKLTYQDILLIENARNVA